MGNKNIIDDKTRLKIYLFTVEEYAKFNSYFDRMDVDDLDGKYVQLQTKLLILRKYDYFRDEVYLPNVIQSVKNIYPERNQEIEQIERMYQEFNLYKTEVSLSDGTVLNLHDAAEDVTYGLYLHADKAKIENLIKTDMSTYVFAVQEYVGTLEKIVLDIYALLNTLIDDKYERVSYLRASVIFKGENPYQEKEIKSAPYWSNLRGTDISPFDLSEAWVNLPNQEREIITMAVLFVGELGKDDYSIKKLRRMILPATKRGWGNFSKAHEWAKEGNFGYSNVVRYNHDKTIAYVSLFKNIPKDAGFIINQAHYSNDICCVNLAKENDKKGWKILAIGDKMEDYKMSGSLIDWIKYVVQENKKRKE